MAFYVWGDASNDAGSNAVGGGFGTKTAWFSKSLSEINTTIRQNVPSNHKITKVIMYFNADYDLAGAGNVYLQYGFGGSGSISTYLYNSGGGTTMNSTTPKDYPSGGVDITSYFTSGNGSVVSPFAIRTDNASHLSAKIWSSNIGSKTFFVKNVRLEVTSEAPTTYTVTVNALPAEGGTITGTGSYTKGSQATVTAVPNAGYKFVGFGNQSGVVTVTSNPYVFTVNNNTTFTAIFEKLHSITTKVSPEGAGSVTGAGTYENGSNATLTATPATDYYLTDWLKNGVSQGTDASPYTVSVTDTAEYTAVFTKYANIYVGITGTTEGGTVTGTGLNLTTSTGLAYGKFKLGDTVTLTATPNAGYEFEQWFDEGNYGPTDNPRTITVTGNAYYYARFKLAKTMPAYIGANQCDAIYVDTENKKIIFYGDIATGQSGGYNTVDGWHFETRRAGSGQEPTGANIQKVTKIFKGATQIY